jgi:2'-5' RNA ligase
MRLFVGMPLAPAVIAELSAISARLQSSRDGLRWTATASWHVTLQFLGNTTPEQCDCIVAALRNVRFTPVPTKLEGLGFFDRAGVFFAEVAITPQLLLLQERVVSATELCGFVRDPRPFHPHITLARSKGSGPRHALDELKARVPRQPRFSSFAAREFLLYESFLGPGGSRYEIRERFPLDAG